MFWGSGLRKEWQTKTRVADTKFGAGRFALTLTVLTEQLVSCSFFLLIQICPRAYLKSRSTLVPGTFLELPGDPLKAIAWEGREESAWGEQMWAVGCACLLPRLAAPL